MLRVPLCFESLQSNSVSAEGEVTCKEMVLLGMDHANQHICGDSEYFILTTWASELSFAKPISCQGQFTSIQKSKN